MQDAAKKNKKSLFKEPLVYFFLLGVIVFGLHAYLTATANDDGNRYQVDITSSDVDWLRTRWTKQMNREPTEREMQGLIDSLIREEILYREAVAMGLDEKDSVIRRRLSQKMEFLFKDLADLQQPTDQQLKDYFLKHQERYRIDSEFSFNHIFFSADKRPQTSRADASAVLDQFRNEKTTLEEAASFGDSIMLPMSYERKTPDQIAKILGNTFSQGLQSVETSQWTGPIQSSYGWHVVFIRDWTQSRLPDFEMVRSSVQTDYLSAQRTTINQQAYDKISSRYTIFVENLPHELQRKQ